MVFSYYLSKYPYQLAYRLLKAVHKPDKVVFYCRELQDWDVFEPVQKFLKPITIVSNKPAIREHFKKLGIKTQRLPVFPKGVIMARHSCHKFPSDEIIKIGLRHGPYHFKKMTRAENYNRFDRYLMTSVDDVSEAIKIGVNCAVAVGYPKLDQYADLPLPEEQEARIRRETNCDPNKPILLFSSTWTDSGMSAILKWYKELHLLKDMYNVFVTLHPWINVEYRAVIRQQGIFLIKGNHLPYMKMADLVIGDTSSLLAEACAMDKPIITWQTPVAKRSLDKIDTLLKSISIRVETWDDLLKAIPHVLANKDELSEARRLANIQMFDVLDGNAGRRAADEILKFFPELKP